MDLGISMVCICDCDTHAIQGQPFFFARPNLILGFGETYVQRFGLQQQADEAFKLLCYGPRFAKQTPTLRCPKLCTLAIDLVVK